MRFPLSTAASSSPGPADAILDGLPRSTHTLVLAALRRDAVDSISVRPRRTNFLRSETNSATVLYERSVQGPLFVAPERALTPLSHQRMHNLLEALSSAGYRPRLVLSLSGSQSNLGGGWQGHSTPLLINSNEITFTLHSITSAGLLADRELAPQAWLQRKPTRVDYTGATLTWALKSGDVILHLGEKPASMAAIIKALHHSLRHGGSAVDLYRPGQLLGSIPHFITGAAAELIRGTSQHPHALLRRIDVAINGQDLAEASHLCRHYPSLRLIAMDPGPFAELQASSTLHQTLAGPVTVGPIASYLVSVTLAQRSLPHSLT